MIKCKICGKEFKNNLGGNLTVHLLNEHNIKMEDYHIITELNGVEPKCQCGLCNERPFFNRGKFSKFALNHDSFKWQEEKYVELYGLPKCQNPKCDNNVNFYRGKPRTYCSCSCFPNQWNQDKVKQTVKEKYDVENVSKLEEVRLKIENNFLKKHGVKYHQQLPDFNMKFKKANLNKYGVENPQSLPEIIEKSKQTMLKNYGVEHYSKTDKFKENASKNMCNYNENVNTNHKIKYYKNTKLYYQSLYEYRFLEFCENNGLLQYVNNSITFKYIDNSYGNWHLPDFIFKENYVIEIKSTYWLNKQGGWNVINAKKESVELCGYQYIFILDEKYDEFYNILT